MRTLLAGIFAACLFCLPLMSQAPTGSISGVVTDATGAVVPGAKVSVTNVSQGISRAATTDEAGRYNMPALIPGPYEIEARMQGFQKEIRKGVQLTVGMNAVINLSLQVGQVELW